MKHAAAIVVLDDGETWGLADSATIQVMDAEQFARVMAGEKPSAIMKKSVMSLKAMRDHIIRNTRMGRFIHGNN